MPRSLPARARVAAGYALTSLVSREDIGTVESLLRNKEARVRWGAIDAFEKVVAPQDLEKVRKMVRSRVLEVRIAGVRALAKIGRTQDLPLLESRFGDTDRNVRWEAALAFGRLGNRGVLTKLAYLTTHRSDEVGHAAGAALVELVAHADLSLIESMLRSEVPFVAGIAVDAFERVAGRGDISKISAMLKSRNEYERQAAVRAAGTSNLREMVSDIHQSLGDENDLVRAFAAEALGKLGAADDCVTLERLVRDEAEDHDVRESALESLANLAEPKDLDRMIALLRDLREEEPGMFEVALERIARRDQISKIESLLVGDSLLSRTAARGFAKVALPQDSPKLHSMLTEGNVSQKIAAALAVGHLRLREFIPLVKSLLADPDWNVVNAAADSFPQIVTREDLPEVLGML